MINESTQAERAHMIATGMQEIPWSEYKAKIDSMGYEIDLGMCHTYTNRANARSYKARSLGIRFKPTRLSWAHIDGPRDAGFAELKEFIFSHFSFVNGRIYET